MVHQFQIHLTLWICFLEKDKTVFERKDSDFILQQSVWETSTGYCTHYWFHGASTVATDNGPTCSSSNLVSSPWLFPRYSNRVQFIQYQRWPSEVFQLCTPRQTSGCSQLPDSSLDGKHECVVLSVDMSQRGNPVQLSYVGKFHKAPRKTKVIQRTDILSIVRASLHCHIFSCTQCSLASDQRSRYWITYQSISLEFGSYIRRKRTWFQTYEQVLSPRTCPFLALRYVDNRYIIFPEERVKDRSTQTPAQEDFYERPVELETVTNSDLHFTETMASQRLCLSRKPYRLRLPGLQPRCRLISRYTYPNSDCPFRIHSLIELYKAKGFQSSDCYRATRKLQKEAEVRFAEFPFFFWPSCRCVWVTLCSKELSLFGFLVLIRRIKYFCFIESFSKQEDCLSQNSGSPTKRLFWDYRYERRT